MSDVAARQALFAERIAAVRALLAERGVPGVLLQTRRNVAWATAGAEHHVVMATETGVAGLLVTPDEAVLIAPINEAARIADEEVSGLDLEVRSIPWHVDGAMDGEARRVAGADPANDEALEGHLLPLRCRLADLEIERMRWLAAQVAGAVEDGLARASGGATEHDVAAAASNRLTRVGARSPVLLVAADERIGRYRHPLPTDRRVEQRLMLVVVAERWGLHLAVTRFAELQPPDDDVRARVEAAAQVHRAMVDATRPGSTLGDVFLAAQEAYAATGHPDEWTLHHQGGIIGYQGRERIATPADPTRIEPGMAFAWNPSITGAKAEETILVTDSGTEQLTVP